VVRITKKRVTITPVTLSPAVAPIPKAAGDFYKGENMFALGWIIGTSTTMGLYLLIKKEQND